MWTRAVPRLTDTTHNVFLLFQHIILVLGGQCNTTTNSSYFLLSKFSLGAWQDSKRSFWWRWYCMGRIKAWKFCQKVFKWFCNYLLLWWLHFKSYFLSAFRLTCFFFLFSETRLLEILEGACEGIGKEVWKIYFQMNSLAGKNRKLWVVISADHVEKL